MLACPGHSTAKRDEYDNSIKALTGYGPHADRQFKGDRSGAGIHTQLGFLFNNFLKKRDTGMGKATDSEYLL